MTTQLAVATINSMADAAVDLVDVGSANSEGKVRVYTGTSPGPDAAVTGTLLAEFDLANPAYGTSTNGVATLLGTPISTTGSTNGTAGWCRVVDRDESEVFDGSVGTSNAEFILNTTTITTGVSVEITSGSFTMPNGT